MVIFGNTIAVDGGEIALETRVDVAEIALDIMFDGGEIGVFYPISGETREFYTGPYEVTPDFDGSILETDQKIMSDDVEVHPITVARVSNPEGGITITIGV